MKATKTIAIYGALVITAPFHLPLLLDIATKGVVSTWHLAAVGAMLAAILVCSEMLEDELRYHGANCNGTPA